MNVPFLQDSTFTGLISTRDYKTAQEWSQAYTTVQSNSGTWSSGGTGTSGLDIATLNTYLSTNSILLCSLNVNGQILSAGVNLFDIFLTSSETDSQTLSYIPSSYELSISNGNTVNLSSINSTFKSVSGKYESTYTTVVEKSANWNTAYNIATTYSLVSNLKQDYIGVNNFALTGIDISEILYRELTTKEIQTNNLNIDFPHGNIIVNNKFYISGNNKLVIYNTPLTDLTNKTEINIPGAGYIGYLAYNSSLSCIYIPTQNLGVHKLDIATNNLTIISPELVPVNAALGFWNNHIYLGSTTGTLRKLDTNGTLLSTINLPINTVVHTIEPTPDNRLLVINVTRSTPTGGNTATGLVTLSSDGTVASYLLPSTFGRILTDDMVVTNDRVYIGTENNSESEVTNTIGYFDLNTLTYTGLGEDTTCFFVAKEYNGEDIYFGALSEKLVKYTPSTGSKLVYRTKTYNEFIPFNNRFFTTQYVASSLFTEIIFDTQLVTKPQINIDAYQILPSLYTTAGSFPSNERYVWYEISGGTIDVSTRFSGPAGNQLGDILVVKNISLTGDASVRRFGSVVPDGLIKPGEMRRWTYTGIGSGPAIWKVEASPNIIGALPTTTYQSASGFWQGASTIVQQGSSNWNTAYNVATAYSSVSSSLVTNTTFNNYKTDVAAATATLLPISIYQSASGNWQSTYTTVCSNSANWNRAYSAATTYQIASGGFALSGYNTTVDDAVSSVLVGGAQPQAASEWKKLSLVQALDTILFPTLTASYTIPIITIESGQTAQVEVGESITPTLTGTFTKNDAGRLSAISLQRNIPTAWVTLSTITNPVSTSTTDIPSQFGFSSPNNPNALYRIILTDTTVLCAIDGVISWRAGSADYFNGLPKKDNKGVNDTRPFAVRTTSAPQLSSAGTFFSSTFTVTGRRKLFYSNDNVATAPANSTQVRALTGVRDGTTGWPQAGTVFDITVNDGSTRTVVAYPTAFGTLDSVIDQGTLLSVTEEFERGLTTVLVSGANGLFPVNYYVYTYISPGPLGATVHRVTI